MYSGKVRIAGAADEEEIMAMCRRLHSENGMFPMDDEKVRSILQKAFNRDGGILGVIGNPGNIEAAIYMMISTFWYSNETHLEELFSYVLPENRKSTNALDLVEFAKWCSDYSKFKLVIGIQSNDQTMAKVRLYRRRLGEPIGAFFFHIPEQSGTVNGDSESGEVRAA